MNPRTNTKLELFLDRAGRWRWRARYSNGRIAATSEAYSSKSTARKSAEALREGIRLGWPEIVEVDQ